MTNLDTPQKVLEAALQLAHEAHQTRNHPSEIARRAIRELEDTIRALASRIPPTPAAGEAGELEKAAMMRLDADAQEAIDKCWGAEWLMVRKPTLLKELAAARQPTMKELPPLMIQNDGTPWDPARQSAQPSVDVEGLCRAVEEAIEARSLTALTPAMVAKHAIRAFFSRQPKGERP